MKILSEKDFLSLKRELSQFTITLSPEVVLLGYDGFWKVVIVDGKTTGYRVKVT